VFWQRHIADSSMRGSDTGESQWKGQFPGDLQSIR